MSLGDRTRLTADLEGIYRWRINLQAKTCYQYSHNYLALHPSFKDGEPL